MQVRAHVLCTSESAVASHRTRCIKPNYQMSILWTELEIRIKTFKITSWVQVSLNQDSVPVTVSNAGSASLKLHVSKSDISEHKVH